MLAPIVLFVYNRPWHTEQALEALYLNSESKDSILYIYADGPKDNSKEELQKIQQTREILFKKKWCKEVKVVASEKNKGLAESVINGTTEIVERYGKVITIEDDVVIGLYFLRFMNEALEMYKKHEKVFMISGYNFPVNEIERKKSSFFLPVSTSQAWGTWKRAWYKFDTDAKGYKKLKSRKKLRSKFNLDNTYDFASMLISQMESTHLSSWAVRFKWSLFMNKGVILFPDKSLIKNIGWDNSGRHCGVNNIFHDKDWQENYHIDIFPKDIKIDFNKFTYLKEYFRAKALCESDANTFNSKSEILRFMNNFKNRLRNYALKSYLKTVAVLREKRETDIGLREEMRIEKLERYLETETIFLNQKLKIVDNASYHFIKKELFESEIYRFKSKNERPYIIDCGANIGLSVIYFKQLFPSAEIVGFEPDDKVFQALQFNIESFQLSNVTLIKKACWDEETTLKFYSEGADAGRAALNSDIENIIEVQTIRLREFLKRKVDFLKIDIEGAETKVLEDCADLLYNVERIFVEYHSFLGVNQSLDRLLKILISSGFRYSIQQHGVVSQSPFIKIDEQYNMDILLNISAYRNS